MCRVKNCPSNNPGSQLAPQSGALVVVMQGRLYPWTTWNGFASLDWKKLSSSKFHSFLPLNSDTKSHQNFSRLLSIYWVMGIRFHIWRYNMGFFGNAVFIGICNDRYMNITQFLLRKSIFVCALTDVSCSKVWGLRERDTFFECLNLNNSNHNIPKQMQNKVIMPKKVFCICSLNWLLYCRYWSPCYQWCRSRIFKSHSSFRCLYMSIWCLWSTILF